MKSVWLFVVAMFMCGIANAAHPIMHLTKAQMEHMNAKRLATVPRDQEHPKIVDLSSLPASIDLTQYLLTQPKDRDQGACGDCWQWGCTAAVEVNLSLQGGADPISVQYINSGMADWGPSGSSYSVGACGGGMTDYFVDWYTQSSPGSFFVPLSNTNASFADGNGPLSNGQSHTPFSEISENPQVEYVSFMNNGYLNGVWTTDTFAAIAAIQQSLSLSVPVLYSFQMSQEGWDAFRSFWEYQSETALWSPSNNYFSSDDGGHEVLIVGYDSDSWIVQNSWGTTSQRPNGQFRLAQNLNYMQTVPGGYAAHYFETISLQFVEPIPGVCGPANGETLSVAPTTNLCSTGVASAVTSTGTGFTWTCAGSNGGSTADCSATLATGGGGGGGCNTSNSGMLSAFVVVGLLLFVKRKYQ